MRGKGKKPARTPEEHRAIMKLYHAEYRKNNGEKLRAYKAMWRAKNKGHLSEYVYNYRHPKSEKTKELIENVKRFNERKNGSLQR